MDNRMGQSRKTQRPTAMRFPRMDQQTTPQRKELFFCSNAFKRDLS